MFPPRKGNKLKLSGREEGGWKGGRRGGLRGSSRARVRDACPISPEPASWHAKGYLKVQNELLGGAKVRVHAHGVGEGRLWIS